MNKHPKSYECDKCFIKEHKIKWRIPLLRISQGFLFGFVMAQYVPLWLLSLLVLPFMFVLFRVESWVKRKCMKGEQEMNGK